MQRKPPAGRGHSRLLIFGSTPTSYARERQIVFNASNVRAFRTVYNDIVREGEGINPGNLTRKAINQGQLAAPLPKECRRRIAFVGDFAVPLTNDTANVQSACPK